MVSLVLWLFIIVIYIGARKFFTKTAENQKKLPPERNDSSRQQPMVMVQKETENGTTTAYLSEKAWQDAVEHAREKREETARLNQKYGGLLAAERYFDGDTVPNGKSCVTCGYCGAKNLIPVTAREHYSCYFCREPIR